MGNGRGKTPLFAGIDLLALPIMEPARAPNSESLTPPARFPRKSRGGSPQNLLWAKKKNVRLLVGPAQQRRQRRQPAPDHALVVAAERPRHGGLERADAPAAALEQGPALCRRLQAQNAAVPGVRGLGDRRVALEAAH